MIPCHWIINFQHFQGTQCLHFQGSRGLRKVAEDEDFMLLQNLGKQCSPQPQRQAKHKIRQFQQSLPPPMSSNNDQNTQYPQPVSHFPHFIMFKAMHCTGHLPMIYAHPLTHCL